MRFLIGILALTAPFATLAASHDKGLVDYNIIIDDAEAKIRDLNKDLDKAIKSNKDTASDLIQTQNELKDTTDRAINLQNDIDKETSLFNQQIRETAEWKQKHAEAVAKLWWYRKIAIAVGSAIALYGAFLVLKVMGKLPF